MTEFEKNSYEMNDKKSEAVNGLNTNSVNNDNHNNTHNKTIVANKISKKSTFKKRLRRVCRTRPHLFVIFVISIIGFCYHFQQSLQQYFEYKTTVSFGLEQPKDYVFEYPAVTVCFPDLIPFFTLKQMFPEYGEAVDSIESEGRLRNDSDFWTKSDSSKFNKFRLKGRHLHKFFEEKLITNLTITEILNAYSHSRADECLLDAKPILKKGYKMNYCEQITKTVESINGDFRCFSYFLKLDQNIDKESDPEWENRTRVSVFSSRINYELRTNKVVYISHSLNSSQRTHPFEKDLRARVSVHSTDMIPVPHFYPTLALYQWSRFYDIHFSKTVSHLLENPYQTKCRKYEKGVNQSQQSFDDCFTRCLAQQYREKCNCLPRSGIMFREQVLTSSDKFCKKINKCQFTNYRLECQEKCQPDCVHEKYDFEKFVDIPFYSNANLTGIQISRRPVPDQIYTHSPSVTFIQLICDFGGLGGLWLGFSVITITTAIISLISKPLEKMVDRNRDEDE